MTDTYATDVTDAYDGYDGHDPAADFDPDPIGAIVGGLGEASGLAARYAVLAALAAGVAQARDAVSAQLTELYRGLGVAKGSVPTPFGPVSMKECKARTTVVIADEGALLAWAELDNPLSVETVRRLLPDARKVYLARFAARAGAVVDTATGLPVPFAALKEVEAGPPTPAYSATPQQQAAKMAAVEFVSARMGAFADLIRAEIASPGSARLELEPGRPA